MAQIPVETPAGAQAKVDAHSTAADPHAGYLTQAEGDGRYVQPSALGDYATDIEAVAYATSRAVALAIVLGG